jgi:tRNA nucleotidyltransferase/poly(A) polymerase
MSMGDVKVEEASTRKFFNYSDSMNNNKKVMIRNYEEDLERRKLLRILDWR